MRFVSAKKPKPRHWLVDALLSMFSDGIFGVAPPPAERQPKARDPNVERRAEAKRWLRGVRNLTLAHRGAFGALPFTGAGGLYGPVTLRGGRRG